MDSEIRRRRQATLFLPDNTTADGLRREFNPEQARLIGSHVTLCREDEVNDWGQLAQTLKNQRLNDVTLDFGRPYREGNLVYLPVVGSTFEFDNLRSTLLTSSSSVARVHRPHITIIHPRNGTCDDSVFQRIAWKLHPFTITFRKVSFIEQVNDGKWRVLDEFPLFGYRGLRGGESARKTSQDS